MRFLRTKATLATFGLALSLAACGGGSDSDGDVAKNPDFPSGTTMARLAKAGKMTVGTKFDQPGFGLVGLNDKPEGFDVEVAKIIAGELGISPGDITWKESPSAVREDLIASGDVDLVAATYTINDLRKERITFAGPYYIAGQQLMVKSDNDKISGPDDIKANPDMKVCSVDGSTPAENIKQYLADPKQLLTFDVYDKCAAALGNGQVDIVTTDNVILLGFAAKSDGDYKLVGEQFTKEPYGLGIKKGDVAFCEFINKTLKDHEADYVAAWKKTAGKIEGTQTPELPAADACA
jgi:glutamate transport system substrate-binding protein